MTSIWRELYKGHESLKLAWRLLTENFIQISQGDSSELIPNHWYLIPPDNNNTIVPYCSVSACVTRNTTGTDVHGTMPTSVITMVISSGGVTSYTRFRRLSLGKSCHDASGPSLFCSTRSLGSPVRGKWISKKKTLMAYYKTVVTPVLIHWSCRSLALSHWYHSHIVSVKKRHNFYINRPTSCLH